MRINVKPLTHWIIYKGYTVRFTNRTPSEVTGILRTADGKEIFFAYDPQSLVIRLAQSRIRIVINDHGWELERETCPDCNSSDRQDPMSNGGTYD